MSCRPKQENSSEGELLSNAPRTTLITPEGETALQRLAALEKSMPAYNIGLLRATLGNPGSTYDAFVPDIAVQKILEEFKAVAEGSIQGRTPSGWLFHSCVRPEKGNWQNIHASSPLKDCSSVLVNPRILRREAEMNFGIARVGDSYFPKVEIAYPDRAEPWPLFVGSEPIKGMIVLRYRPSINYNKLVPVLAIGNTRPFGPETRENLKRGLQLESQPVDLATLSDYLVKKARFNENVDTFLASLSAAAVVLGISDVIAAGSIIGSLGTGSQALGAKAISAKIGTALFKLGLGGTGALYETARILRLNDFMASLPEDSPLRGPVGLALQIAQFSTFFAVADLVHLGHHLTVDAFRILVEGKVLVAVGHGLNPRTTENVRQALSRYWPQLQDAILSANILNPSRLEELGELVSFVSGKGISAFTVVEATVTPGSLPSPVPATRDSYLIADSCPGPGGVELKLDIARDKSLRLSLSGPGSRVTVGQCQRVKAPLAGDNNRYAVTIKGQGIIRETLTVNFDKKMIHVDGEGLFACNSKGVLQNMSAFIEYCSP